MNVNKAVVSFLAGCLIVVGSAGPKADHQTGIAPQRLPSTGVTFVDVAEEAGLRFQHVSGSKEKRYILEAMGSGVAWLDSLCANIGETPEPFAKFAVEHDILLANVMCHS